MELHQPVYIKLGRFKDFHLSNLKISKWISPDDSPFNFLANDLWDELSYKFLKITCRRIFLHGLHHFRTDIPDLTLLCICDLSHLSLAPFCEKMKKYAINTRIFSHLSGPLSVFAIYEKESIACLE